MNRWIIFIIIVAAVAVIGVGVNLFTNSTQQYTVNPDNDETVIMQQESGPIVRFANISDEHLWAVTRGVLVVHNQNFSMNFLGTQPPKEYKTFAEPGIPSAVIALLKETAGVSGVFEVPSIESGITQEVTIPLSSISDEGYTTGTTRISYMAPIMDKITETGIGMVWLNGYTLYDAEGNQAQGERILTEIIDIDTTGNRPVQHHPEFYTGEAATSGVIQITIDI